MCVQFRYGIHETEVNAFLFVYYTTKMKMFRCNLDTWNHETPDLLQIIKLMSFLGEDVTFV